MTTLYFFGDSWPAEGPMPGVKEELVSYPSLVGQELNLPVSNHSVLGTSQSDMIQQLLNSGIQANDVAVFSVTAYSRQFYYDENGNKINVSKPEDMAMLKTVNDYNGVWQSAQNCYLLYSICRQWNITPCFLNTFNNCYLKHYHHKLWDLIPDDVWILPKDKCVVQEFDPVYFGQYDEYRNSDYRDWLKTNNAQVQYYIRPHEAHPHVNGRKKIAEIISKFLSTNVLPSTSDSSAS